MEWYFVLLIVLAILIVLLILPLFLSCRMYFNVKQNLGVVLISLWGITLSCFQIEFKKTAIKIIKSRGKDKEIQINLIDEKAIFLEHFVNTVFRYIKINEVSVFFEAGKKDDACTSSLINGAFLNFIHCVYSMLFTLKGEFRAYISTDADTTTNTIKLTLFTNIFVTPFMFLISFIRAKLRTKRTVKVYERFKARQR
ncbi:MAG: hypothetical protein J6C13_01190 [Clostridia bacterium]|nr:hypothetical protein [Clostridia bacterium]